MQSPPSVSEWKDMPVAQPMSAIPEFCGAHPAVPGRVIEFFSPSGDVFSPAIRIGGDIPVVSYRMLDRDIEGVFHGTIVSITEEANVPLLDFEFSEGMFEGVQAGCRVRALAISVVAEAEPAMQRLIDVTNDAGRPTKWQLVQSVDIKDAASETWASEEFWVIPESMSGTYGYRRVRISDPYYERGEL